jgi:hypothetical protein
MDDIQPELVTVIATEQKLSKKVEKANQEGEKIISWILGSQKV